MADDLSYTEAGTPSNAGVPRRDPPVQGTSRAGSSGVDFQVAAGSDVDPHSEPSALDKGKRALRPRPKPPQRVDVNPHSEPGTLDQGKRTSRSRPKPAQRIDPYVGDSFASHRSGSSSSGSSFQPTTRKRPKPVVVNGELQYQVDCILSSRKRQGTEEHEYEVRWKGYPNSRDNSWRTQAELEEPGVELKQLRDFQNKVSN